MNDRGDDSPSVNRGLPAVIDPNRKPAVSESVDQSGKSADPGATRKRRRNRRRKSKRPETPASADIAPGVRADDGESARPETGQRHNSQARHRKRRKPHEDRTRDENPRETGQSGDQTAQADRRAKQRQPDQRNPERDERRGGSGDRPPQHKADEKQHTGSRHKYRGGGSNHGKYRRNAGTRQLYAALDLGTNNCRLLVAEPQDRGFRVVDAFSRIVRLGEGISRTGKLSDPAMERAITALHVCRKKLADRGVERVRLIATEACRSAGNGMAFLERVHAETGLKLEIVSRETEARLAVAGCSTLVDPKAAGVVLFDIGGGSSELVWLDLRGRSRERGVALTRFIRSWTSMPLGVVTLSERHGGVHVTTDVFEDMVADVAEHLNDFSDAELLDEIIVDGNIHMLGTSGTVTTLAGVHLGLERYDRRQVDGIWLENEDVNAMIGRLLSMTYEERVANPCIGADRADLVLAGCAILEAIRRRWPCQRLRVADRGLREGILVEQMAADGVWRRWRRRRNRFANNPNRGPK